MITPPSKLMICRHGPDDPGCSSNRRYVALEPVIQEPKTPDKFKYEIVDACRVGSHLVLKVLYPNCKKCSYEGNKVLVFLGVSEMQVLKWKEIDPHFRETHDYLQLPSQAPSPAARFPASQQGWEDALAYAKSKAGA